MLKLCFITTLFTISCIGWFKTEPEEDEEDEQYRLFFEGDQYGDCFDEEDNDEDGLIDCEDPGCTDKPICQDDVDTNNPEDTADTGETITNGQMIHDNICMGCHASNQLFEELIPTVTDQEIVDAVQIGRGNMPSLNLNNEEADDVLAYLRATYGAYVPTEDTGVAIELQAAVEQIFWTSCAGYCHSGSTVPNLSEDLCDAIVNVASTQLSSMKYVLPGSPANSYLWHKLEGTATLVGGLGSSMPVGGSLSSEDRQTIEDWITSGVDCP